MNHTITIPEYLSQRIQRLADLSGRDFDTTLVDTLGRSLPPLTDELDTLPVSELDDDTLLQLADSKMDTDHNTRMSELLYRQQAATASDAELAELQMLMELYDIGQLRKTQAAVEAVKRGLWMPGRS